MSFLRPCSHEIRHRSTPRRTRLARAARGPARGVARASRFGHGRPDAFARCAGRLRRHQDHRRLRSAAWPARRQAGQHDRVAGLQRSGAWHPGVQPLRRGAQADRRDDGCIRRASWSICRIWVAASTRSSRRCVTCSKRRRRHRKAVWVLDRPNPVGPAGRRSDAARRLGKLCRRRTAADASRAHARRARSVVRQDAQARCRVSRHRDAGLAARGRAGIRLAARRAHVDQSQSQRAESVDGARLCGHGDARGHDALGRARHHAAARTVRRARYRCAGGHDGDGARWRRSGSPAAACASAGSSRRFTSMRASFATACRSTPKVPATITRRSSRGASRRSPSRRSAGLYPDYPLWRDFAYEYEHGKLAIDVINGGPLLREWVDDASATPQDLDALARVG